MIAGTFKNLFFLGTMQVTNYLVPIIVIPVLLERIGLEKYGIIVFAQGICSIAVAITDYGLNISGTREISQNLSDRAAQRVINSKVLTTRIILLAVGFIILLMLVQLFPRWRAESTVILTSYTIVIAQGLLPQWFFEGIQKMHFLTLLTFLSRVLYFLCIIYLIESESDYVLVNLMNGFSWLLCSIIGLGVVFKKSGFPIFRLQMDTLKQILKDNFHISFSNLIAAGYRNGPILIAGSIFSPSLLGVYGVLDKVISLINSSGVILFRSMFPEISEKAKKNNPDALKQSKRFLTKITMLTIPGALLLAFLGPTVLAFVSDKIEAIEVSAYFYFIGFLPLLVLMNLRYTLPLLAFDLGSAYLKFNLTGFVTLIIFGPLSSFLLGINGLLMAIIITEIGMISVGAYLLKKNGIPTS